jgi:glycosyltransferase involved in cell wall biosynthesis
MNVLFVGTSPEQTGAAAHFLTLAQAVAAAGHQLAAVVHPDGLIAQGLASSGIRIYPAHFRNAFDLRGYAAVLAAARRERPDWLVGNFGKEYWPLIVLGRLLALPVALFRHRAPPMKRVSNFFVPRLAQRFFAVSQYARQTLLDRGVPTHLVDILYNPVNLDLCRADSDRGRAIRRRLGIPQDAIVLGYVGRMHGSKGIFTLLEAANQAMEREQGLHCLWVGEGPDARTLRTRAAAHPLGSRHHFCGWTDDVLPYYNALSMLAFPSITAETFGRVSVEAQAAGVPVLGSNLGGIPETLSPGSTGLLLPPGEVGAWRDAILALCDPDRRLPMGRAAQAFVLGHFSMPVIASSFVRMLGSPRADGSPSSPALP